MNQLMNQIINQLMNQTIKIQKIGMTKIDSMKY